MQRAMARQAEAERERRAKVINAEGEFQASERLKDAALVIEQHPIALQLRYLQTLLEIGSSNVDDDRLPGADRPDSRRSSSGQAAESADERDRAPRDPLSGRVVAIAPGRASRPGASRRVEPPPDATSWSRARSARAARTGRRPRRCCPARRTPWQVRVVPNLYPAFERQEVVVHVPRTSARWPSSTTRSSTLVAEAWRLRAGAARDGLRPRARQRGRGGGAASPHTHSQLVWLPEAPPVVAPSGRPVPATARSVAVEPDERLVVAERDGVILFGGVGRPVAVRAADRAGRARGRPVDEPAASALRSRWRPTGLRRLRDGRGRAAAR